MVRALEWVFLLIIHYCYRIIRTFFHLLLALAYWSRDRKAPFVRDPILQMSATELAKQIREGKLTSECVIRTFIDRILEVDPYVHATVERRFNDALQEARDADALVASGRMTRLQLAREKPLLGIPFTVKVLLTVKGLRSTAASLLFKDVRAQDDAVAVAQMKKAGAIVLATTNSAEMGMNFETNNHVHGTTCNPYDTSKTSGGSSGGESALLAAAGSVIGLGNDLAGSIRVPCMFCGLFGHKPTRGLVSNEGCFPGPVGKVGRLLYTGPMCRYATDLVTTMKILASTSENRDKFGREVDFENMKIYYMSSFGDMPLAEKVNPEICSIIQKVSSYFETKHGSKLKQANIPLFKKSNRIYIHSLLSSVPNIIEGITAGKANVDATQELLKFLFRQSPFTAGVIVAMNCHSIPLLYNEDCVEYYKKLEQELDKELSNLLADKSVLILPTLPFAAPYHNEIPLLVGSTCYTHIFNVLGLPSTQCPVGFNRKGLPIGVQVVSGRGNDHLTIACAVELEKAFGGWIPPT